MASQSETMLEENFFFNSMVCAAQAQLFRVSERQKIYRWLSKLHSIVDPDEAEETAEDVTTNYHRVKRKHELRETRNDYMWYLLLVLQNNRLTAPFADEPPEDDLLPLTSFLPTKVYDEVMETSVQNYTWLEQVLADEEQGGDVTATPLPTPAPPSKFVAEQPTPNNGFICYASVFSNQRS